MRFSQPNLGNANPGEPTHNDLNYNEINCLPIRRSNEINWLGVDLTLKDSSQSDYGNDNIANEISFQKKFFGKKD